MNITSTINVINSKYSTNNARDLLKIFLSRIIAGYLYYRPEIILKVFVEVRVTLTFRNREIYTFGFDYGVIVHGVNLRDQE